jgi:opacity protein-like surface antigen
MVENPREHRTSEMKKFLTVAGLLAVIATPAFAQSFDPEGGTGNVLAFSYGSTAPRNDRMAAHHSELHSFAMVPGFSSSRVPQFDYRRGTSEYPYGPGYNFPYPDRPYGDPDHW